jgi:hypothetical protein
MSRSRRKMSVSLVSIERFGVLTMVVMSVFVR